MPRSAAEYGYVQGTILGSSGYLRVTVSPEQTTVDYRRKGRAEIQTAQAYSVFPAANRRP